MTARPDTFDTVHAMPPNSHDVDGFRFPVPPHAARSKPSAKSAAARLAAAARRIGIDCRCFHVMRLTLDHEASASLLPPGLAFVVDPDVCTSPDEVIRECAWYGGEGAHGFGIARGGRIVCLQWIWYGERARRDAFWTLGPSDAVSMHLVTVPDERCRGYATHLKRLSAAWLTERAFEAVISRIWWTNVPSLRVSEKAGWQRIGTTFSVDLGGSRLLAWRWRRAAASRRQTPSVVRAVR